MFEMKTVQKGSVLLSPPTSVVHVRCPSVYSLSISFSHFADEVGVNTLL